MNIREAKKSDAEALLVLFAKLDSESDFMLFEPKERQITTSEQEAIIDSFSKISNRLMLIADFGKVAGVCVLAGNQQRRNSHVASLVIGVLKSKWKQGIGSRLLETVIARAEGAGIKRIELTVRTNNEAAIALYTKYGFVKEGERMGSLNVGGKLVNEYYMAMNTSTGCIAGSIVN